MQRTLLYKLIAILALTLLICIPIALIQGTISERNQYHDQAVASVAADSVREQTVLGPVLVIPYTDQYDEQVTENGKAQVQTYTVARQHIVFPNALKIDGSFDTDRRHRGIHQVLVYRGKYGFSGDFTLPASSELPRANPLSRITLGRPTIAMGVEDVRGIRDIPRINWGGTVLEFEQGSGLAAFREGVHVTLDPTALAKPQAVSFAFNLGLDGIERQHFVPVGKNNVIHLTSKWPHAQFGGRFLPPVDERTTGSAGFDATWHISSLSSNAKQQLLALQDKPMARAETLAALDRFNVGFIEPVNVYSMAERATKYGMLFVVLTFASFFMFEILKRLPIHPVQYLLVGLALVLFFLLLVSLSERIDFLLSYLIASIGCIVLIGFYLSFVLRDWRRGMGFGCALTTLYAALYGLLISENNALILGSLLLFAILAAVMVATRKVDWYQFGKGELAPEQA
jgi:inner membrane protein